MKKTQRIAAVGALAALTFSIAACSSEEAASTVASATSAASSAAPTTEAEATTEAETSAAAPAGDGVTTADDIIDGGGCALVPTEGEGSVTGMIDDAVGTAASNNPLFTTLVAAVGAAGLVDALNDTTAAYTVFGPVDDAFAALPAGTVDTLLADPTGDLTTILTYHVIPERYDAAGLVDAGAVTSLQGEDVTITGTADAPLINGNPVLCGNIPTANATVFAIGQVLTPPSLA